MRWLAPFVVLALVLLLAAPAAAQGNPVTITLPAVNGSGESGTVTLTPSGGTITELIIVLSNQPLLQTQYQTINGQKVINPSTYGGAAPQLASIYTGTCASHAPTSPPNLGATTPNGPNVTGNGWLVIKMPVDQILAGHYVVAVHKDATEASPLVACAALVAGPERAAPGAGALPQTGSPRLLLGFILLGGLGLIGVGRGLRGASRRGAKAAGSSPSETEVRP